MEPLVIVADIGGTNTRVALADGRRVREDSVIRYRNADATGLADVLARYMATQGVTDVDGICVDAAGPVTDGEVRLTNLDWEIHLDVLRRAVRAERAGLLNDLQAQAYGLADVPADRLRTLIDRPAQAGQTQLVFNLGTGVNAAPVFIHGGRRIVPPSECGHINMPIRTEADLRLARFVERHHGFPGVEDVLSGRGVERLWQFVTTEAGRPSEATSAEVVARLQAGDADALAVARLFARLVGTECGNLALIFMPFGGIALCGGLARAFAPWLTDADFGAAFRDKGRFQGFMDQFRISVVEDDFAGLTGCAAWLADMVA
jgi:glucokinase